VNPIPDPLTGKTIEEVGKLLPEVYKDTLQPAAREVGSVLGRTVRMALSPARGLAWTWEHAEQWLEEAVSQRFTDRAIEVENVVSPRPQLAAGVIRGVQASGPEPDPTLRELFANLLATAMQGDRSSQAHPAFAEILTQLIPDEAKILRALARRTRSPVVLRARALYVEGYIPVPQETFLEAEILSKEVDLVDPDRLESYVDNLHRLGLVRSATESFEHEHLVAAEGGFMNDPKRRERWRIVREYLNAYGVEGLRGVLDAFESRCAGIPPAGGGRRAGISLDVLWATSFGEQLLRATVTPEEFGTLAEVTLDDAAPPDEDRPRQFS
jgi:hypothetical protein